MIWLSRYQRGRDGWGEIRSCRPLKGIGHVIEIHGGRRPMPTFKDIQTPEWIWTGEPEEKMEIPVPLLEVERLRLARERVLDEEGD